MLRRSALLLIAALAAACVQPPDAGAPADATVTETVRRLGAILDYVAADYAEAVEDGAIINQAEYDEQLAFLDDALALAGELPAADLDVAGPLGAIRARIEALAPADEIAEATRSLRREVMDAFGVVLAPAAPPSSERGRQLYGTHCASCHGADGAADTPTARELTPPPRSFLDPAVMADLSPVRAFNALTDGIEDTAMAPYEMLSPSDRWSLAFYVFTLRHEAQAVERGRAAHAESASAIAATATRLANLSDEELLAELRAAGLEEARAADALAHLRTEAAFERSGAPMDEARRHLAAAVEAYRGGDAAGARRAAAAAYLDGFEPHEGRLGAADADMVRRLEAQFLSLREAIAAGAPADQIEQQALRIGAMLDGADELLVGRGGNRMAFAGALVILLREGLEGALLILLLLGIARRADAAEPDTRAVHIGWVAALGLGAVTWLASGSIIERLGGARRELIEGVVALAAAAVLLAVGHFVLARLDARRRVAALKQRLAAAASAPQRRLVLASLAFVAVYREALETVLFLRAILLDASASGWAVAAGAATGAAILIAAIFALARLGQRLRPAPLLTALGLLLCALAMILAGNGTRSLQEAGAIAITPITAPRLDWIGLYPTLQTVGAQLIVLCTFTGLALWARLRNRASS